MTKSAVFYTDGSYSSKFNKSGVGVVGYTYTEAKKSRNIKLPSDEKYRLTTAGILLDTELKEDECIEGLDWYECVVAILDENSNNAVAEVMGLVEALKFLDEDPEIEEAKIFIDNEYVVNGYMKFLDSWKERGWRTSSGKDIASMGEWKLIDHYRTIFKEQGRDIKVLWVKGHSSNKGNQLADYYATMGTNYGKHYPKKNDSFEELLRKVTSITEYRKELKNSDISRYYKLMLFTNKELPYSMYTNPKDVEDFGMRYNKTLYSLSTIPEAPYVSKLKSMYRDIVYSSGKYILSLNSASNRNVVRDLENLPVKSLVEEVNTHKGRKYRNFHTKEDMVYETSNLLLQPFLLQGYEVFTVLRNFMDYYKQDKVDQVIDLTDRFLDGKKLKITNKDKIINISLTGYQKVVLELGADLPSYLMLNNLAPSIEYIKLLVDRTSNPNTYTLCVLIKTEDGEIYSSRGEDSYITFSNIQ